MGFTSEGMSILLERTMCSCDQECDHYAQYDCEGKKRRDDSQPFSIAQEEVKKGNFIDKEDNEMLLGGHTKDVVTEGSTD